VDSSSPPVFFYGTSEDPTENELVPRKERPKFDPRMRSERTDDFRPSSLWIEPANGPTFEDSLPKIKPRYDHRNEVGLQNEQNRDEFEPRYDLRGEVEHGKAENDVKRRQDLIEEVKLRYDLQDELKHENAENGVEPKQDHSGEVKLRHDLQDEVDPDNAENEVEPRQDRMDDFQPYGGLVPMNGTMLRAVGLVQEKVIRISSKKGSLPTWQNQVGHHYTQQNNVK
jgi:hypothetical protein